MSSLVMTHPDLALQWHPSKNELQPSAVTFGSSRKVWWLGPCGHEWEAQIGNRVAHGSGCPFCANKKVLTGFNDLLSQHPDVAAEWHPRWNGDLRPANLLHGTPRKVWWLGTCGHEWDASVRERVRGTTCPFCAGRRVLTGFNDLASVDPSLAAQWHPERNGGLVPASVTSGSSKRVWWRDEHGHEWRSSVASRVGGHGCPYCSGRNPVAGTGDLVTLCPALGAQWHPEKNGDLLPSHVSPGAKRRVWWLDEHGHEWASTVKDRAAGHHCPYCSGRVAIIGETDLASQRPEIARQWHPHRNGELEPNAVTFGSSRLVWWLCPDGHEWETRVTYRTTPGGSGCPLCFPHWSRGEKEVVEFIGTRHPELVIIENDRQTLGSRKEIDIYLPSVRVGIEYNGLYWHDESDPKVKANHAAKASAARSHGICLVIVWEDDWKARRPDVERALVDIIGGGTVPDWLTYRRATTER